MLLPLPAASSRHARSSLSGATRRPFRSSTSCRRGPGFAAGAELRARCQTRLGNWEQAILDLREGIQHAPDDGGLRCALVLALLHRNRLDEAQSELDAARAVGSALVEDLGAMLSMARRGPDWDVRHEYESKHYVVASNIDEETCRDAAKVLEDSYTMLRTDLEWVRERRDQPKFRVFLFAGQAGYSDYCSRILGGAMTHSAGLYSPVLNQLLIWNLPRREDMLRTVRHEGFHQYLDLVAEDAPLWFNEGMAEYYEGSRMGAGRARGGQVRRDHLLVLEAALSGRDIVPLSSFLHMSRDAFYASGKMELHYAQGWAVVHFLRKGPARFREPFRTLMARLVEGATSKTAVTEAFAGLDLQELDASFVTYLRDLLDD